METLNLKEFVEDLNKYNTFVVEGQLCLGGVITKNYKDSGIMVLTDLNHWKWIVREWEVNHITKIEKNRNNDRYTYRIVFDNLPPKNITCYNRNDTESIPTEDCGTDFLKLIDKDIFDDTTSFLVEDDWRPMAVIGLDLRKLRLNNRQKCKIAKELNNIVVCRNSPPENDSSETLCLVVEIGNYDFSFQGLDINTLDRRFLNISDDLHKNNKVKQYVQAMTNSYNSVYKNIKVKTDLMRELSELTSSIS